MSDIETRQKKLPVLLFIRGEQYFDDVDPDATELTTEGTLELTEKGLLLTYQETALTGMEGTTTTFEVSGPQVILRRVGSVNSQMVFEEGRQHTSLYETPYGELSVDIQTSALRHNLSERGRPAGDQVLHRGRAYGDRKKQLQDPGKAKVRERSGKPCGSASKYFGGAKIFGGGRIHFARGFREKGSPGICPVGSAR